MARLIDRPIRPMIQPGWTHSTQLLTWVLSYDGIHSPEPLAITAAGAALALSDVPLRRAVAGARVALLPDRGFVVNPTVEEQVRGSLAGIPSQAACPLACLPACAGVVRLQERRPCPPPPTLRTRSVLPAPCRRRPAWTW